MLSFDARDLAAAREWLEAHDRFLASSGAVPGRAEGQTCWAAYFRAIGNLQRSMRHAQQARTLTERRDAHDTTLAFVERATHGFTPMPEFGDTFGRTIHFVKAWLAERS